MNCKKLWPLALTLIMLLSFNGCKNEAANSNDASSYQSKTLVDKSISNFYTSRDEDIIHERDLSEQSNWIYYHNPDDQNKLYKRSIDGTKKLKIVDNCIGSYCLDGDWIYYSDSDDNDYLYRIRTDGSDKEELNNDSSSSINVSREWVYYKNSSDNAKIYKVKKDGTNRTKLGDDSVWNIYVGGGDWIYYSSASENNITYMIGMDGKEKTKITDASSYGQCISKDWIYYIVNGPKETNYQQIYKVKKDGTGQTCLAKTKPYETIIGLKVSGDYIYYNTYNSDNALYRVKKDGTDFKKLSLEGEHIGYFDTSKDGMLFTSTFYSSGIYKINLKDKIETQLNTPTPLDAEHLAEWIVYNDKKNKLGLNIVNKEGKYKDPLLDRTANNIKVAGNSAYFLVETGDFCNLYKLDIGSSEPKLIAEGNITAYDVSGEFIYYYDKGDHTIYSIKTDGTKMKQISKNKADYIQVDGEWIYYTFMNNEIHRIRLDGTGEQKLATCNWTSSSFKIYNNYIFFSDEKGLSRIKTDGTEKKKLFEDLYGIGNILSISNGRIYYENIIAEGGGYYSWINGLYSIKLDGTDKQTLLEGTFNSWAVDDDSAYYSKIIRDINIIKAKPDGTGRKKVISNLGWY